MKAGITFLVLAAVAVVIIVWGVVCSSRLLVSVPTPPFSSVTLGKLLKHLVSVSFVSWRKLWCLLPKIVVEIK